MIIGKTISGNGLMMDFKEIKIMGIVNATPDSFYTGGQYQDFHGQQKEVERMVEEGVDILDLGAVSTRPGAAMVDAEEEWKRLAPLLKWIRENYPQLFISVDTFRSEIVRRANDYGVNMINDISAGKYDDKLWETIAAVNLPYILMHMQGDPANMQDQPVYENVTQEIIKYFIEKIALIRKAGVQEIIIDPGFGFGKTIEHNYELLNHLEGFKVFEELLLVGMSRKSMLYKYLNINPSEALNSSTVVHTIAAMKGASIFRVHDVKEAVEIKNIIKMLKY